ncbi:MAG: CinA family protein [Thermoflexus sp.]|jgi:PncC family amidohydrolase|nr:CinA family protein [Thermoflexus sp.]
MEQPKSDRAAQIEEGQKERGGWMAVAESCTGDLLGHRLTNIPGSSACFLDGIVACRSEIKARLLGMREEMPRRFGAFRP